MTLREKFKKCKDASNTYYVLPIADDAEQLEQIADDYAIKFAFWLLTEKDETKTLRELFEIFKKQNDN